MAKTRYAQAQAMANTGFLGMVEASVMKVAWDVLQDEDDPQFIQRSGLSRLILGGDAPRTLIETYMKNFGWFAVNIPTVQQQAYEKTTANPSGGFFPQQITDEAMDEAIGAFWNTAAGVMPMKIEPMEAIRTQLFEGPSPFDIVTANVPPEPEAAE